MDPKVLYWVGVAVACVVYTYLICRIIDGIWDTELTGAVLGEFIWNLLLRPLAHWTFGMLALLYAGCTVVAVAFTLENPWKSLAWVILAVPAIRILIWLFWLTHADADTTRWAKNQRADQQGIRGWNRILLWCFCWGEHEGLMTPQEKAYWRTQRKAERQRANAG